MAAVEVGFRSDGVRQVTGSWGFIDRAGTWTIPAKYKAAESFSEGLAAVSFDGVHFGYINRQGALVIEAAYWDHSEFSEGLAMVWPDEGEAAHYIDKAGRLL